MIGSIGAVLLVVGRVLAVPGWTSVQPPVTAYRGGTPVATYPARTIAHPDPGGNAIIRPSAGETVTAGSTYTIRWDKLAGDIVQLELHDQYGNARGYGDLCAGWIINSKCGTLAKDLQNKGEFAWQIKLPPPSIDYGRDGAQFRLQIWLSTNANIDTFLFPYATTGPNFTIVEPEGYPPTPSRPSRLSTAVVATTRRTLQGTPVTTAGPDVSSLRAVFSSLQSRLSQLSENTIIFSILTGPSTTPASVGATVTGSNSVVVTSTPVIGSVTSNAAGAATSRSTTGSGAAAPTNAAALPRPGQHFLMSVSGSVLMLLCML